MTSILLEAGVVSRDQVDEALARQSEGGPRIGEILVALGMITEEDIGWALARQLEIPFVDVDINAVDHDLVRSFPEGLLHRLQMIPLVRSGDEVSVALADPTEIEAIEDFERAAGAHLTPSVATPSAVRRALDEILRTASSSAGPLDATKRNASLWGRSGASFLVSYLNDARKCGASAIHFIPREQHLDVHFRVGGKLVPHASESEDAIYPLLAALDTLGGPSIDGQGLHASGRVVRHIGDSQLSLDVSLLNCADGIAVTLALDPGRPTGWGLEDLGFDPIDLARIRGVLDQPAGLLLIAGPPRSGVSTTLTSMLAAIDLDERRAIAFGTRLQPIAARMPYIVLPADELLTSWENIVVAQDVDVVAINDVFDGNDVRRALSNASAGRLVIARTDWNDSFALIESLSADPHTRSALATRLQLVIQQRAVHAQHAPTNDSEDNAPRADRVVFEVLCINDAMRAVIRDGAPIARLRELAAADGLRPLAKQLETMVTDGLIDPAAVGRAIG